MFRAFPEANVPRCLWSDRTAGGALKSILDTSYRSVPPPCADEAAADVWVAALADGTALEEGAANSGLGRSVPTVK